MANEDTKEQDEVIANLYKMVIEQIKLGTDKTAIAQKMVELGVDPADSTQLADSMHSEVMATVAKEQMNSKALLLGLLGAVLAALISGFVWGGIVIATGYEVGYAALGIGFLCGYAVVLFTGGKRGLPLQLIAALGSILGVVIGKYCTFYYFLREELIKEHGQDAIAQLSLFSSDVIQFFAENISQLVGGFDLLWVILAIVMAWGIPKGTGIKI